MVPYFSGQSGTWYDISRTTAAVATNSFGLVGVTCSVAMYTYFFLLWLSKVCFVFWFLPDGYVRVAGTRDERLLKQYHNSSLFSACDTPPDIKSTVVPKGNLVLMYLSLSLYLHHGITYLLYVSYVN